MAKYQTQSVQMIMMIPLLFVDFCVHHLSTIRLEQRNEALEAQVLGLRANLEQQRRWYSAVEMRLSEVERARADADRRNAELQGQMEQFFDAFGELTNEAKKTERIVQGF